MQYKIYKYVILAPMASYVSRRGV